MRKNIFLLVLLINFLIHSNSLTTQPRLFYTSARPELSLLPNESLDHQAYGSERILNESESSTKWTIIGVIGGIIIVVVVIIGGVVIYRKYYVMQGNHQEQLISDQEKLRAETISQEFYGLYQSRLHCADFDEIKRIKDRMFNLYIAFLPLKTISRIANPKSTKIIVGQSGVGKTSLINTFLETNEPTALSDCTTEVKSVFSRDSVEVFDSPGEISSFDIENVKLDCEQLNKANSPVEQLAGYDQVYVIYDTSLKVIQEFVKVLCALMLDRLIFVRNKCDNFDERQKRTVNEEVQVDKNLLEKWGIPRNKIKIFKASAERDILDNQILKNHLLKKIKLA